MSTILIIEDEPAIAEMLRTLLRLEGHEGHIAPNVQAAHDFIEAHSPDLVLLDWMLPGMSGIEYLQRLRRAPKTQNLPIIMITARDTQEDLLEGLDRGADDYISKPFSPKELMARIKALLRRARPEQLDDVVTLGDLRLDPSDHTFCYQGKTERLTPTECRMLHFFITHPGRVYSRAQLLDLVWGDTHWIEERTVDVTIRRLRKALASTPYREAIETVRGSGYRFQYEENAA